MTGYGANVGALDAHSPSAPLRSRMPADNGNRSLPALSRSGGATGRRFVRPCPGTS